jgi:hypothetical protein
MVDVTGCRRVDVTSDGICGLSDLVDTSSSEEPRIASFLNSFQAGHIATGGSAFRAKSRGVVVLEIQGQVIRWGRMKHIHVDGRGY